MALGGWQKLRLTIILAIAFSAEYADTVVLSSMYLAIGRALQIGVAQLGTLSMWRALVQAICVPFAGIVGNIYNRLHLVAAGTIIWGAMSAGMGFATNYREAAAWTALNGVGLALVMPCAQSIMAEAFPCKERGRAFGALFTLSAFGAMLANFLAISYSNRQIGRFEGWRVIYYGVACLAGATAIAVLWGGIEPRYIKPKQAQQAAREHRSLLQAIAAGLMLILRNTWQVFRIRSFQIIILAGIIGTISFSGIMGYRILYFQLLGFSAVATATMTTCTTVGVAVGFVVGGAAGDALAVKFPNASRPFINQLSMALAGPLSVVLFKAMPGCSKYASGVPGSLDHLLWQYSLLEFFIGALGCFPVSNNAALFAEIVPENIRTSVYAFDHCITSAIGAAFTPLTGILAEKLFGFKNSANRTAGAAPPPAAATPHARAAQYHKNLVNARALEDGLLWVMVIPMVIKFFIYFLLYWTLPKDRIEEPEAVEGGSAADVEQGAAKGKSAAQQQRISPPLPASGDSDEQQPAARPGSGGKPALRRSTSGMARKGSLPAGAREALAARVVQTAQGRGEGVSAEQLRAQRAASLQRNSSLGHRARSASIDSVSRFFALEVSPPVLSPRRGGKVSDE